METVADLLASARDREGHAFDPASRATAYSARQFVTDCWRAGNLLTHFGLPGAGPLAIVVGPRDPGPGDEPGFLGEAAAPLQAILGGLAIGATVALSPPQTPEAGALVVPARWTDRYDPDPGCSVLAYGEGSRPPAVGHFESQTWGENPTEPPEPVDASTLAVQTPSGPVSQGTLLERARAVVTDTRIGADDLVVVSAPVDSPGALVAGVLAPLLAGARIAPPGGDRSPALRIGEGSAGDLEPSTVI